MDLDGIPLWPGDHVVVKELWSYYAQYLYLPRLRDRTVLLRAIEQGVGSLSWEQDAFAYADAYDEATGRYRGLIAGAHVDPLLDRTSVIVKPAVARQQFDQESRVETIDAKPGVTSPAGAQAEASNQAEPDGIPKRFYGSVELDPLRVGRDASQIAEAIIQHLAGLVHANVEVRLDIQAEIPDGAPDEVVRTVTENARTLKFDRHGFELA